MPIYSQICPLVSEEKVINELIYIIIENTALPLEGPHLLMEKVGFSKFWQRITR